MTDMAALVADVANQGGSAHASFQGPSGKARLPVAYMVGCDLAFAWAWTVLQGPDPSLQGADDALCVELEPEHMALHHTAEPHRQQLKLVAALELKVENSSSGCWGLCSLCSDHY